MEQVQIPWKSTKEGIPEKSGKYAYEQVPCLVIRGGFVEILSWNCEDENWDDESGDEYECDRLDVEYYIPISQLSNPAL